MTIQEIVALIKNSKIKFEYGYIDPKSSKNKVESYILKNSLTSKPCTISVDPVGYAVIKNFKIIKENIVYLHGLNNDSFYIIREDNSFLKHELHFLNENTLLIHELVSKWAKHPRMETAKKIEKSLVPVQCKKVDYPLYRGLNLSLPALQKLANGLKAQLKKTSYSSWSNDITLAAAFVEEDGVVLKYFPRDEVVIDINAFEKLVFDTLEYYPRLNEKEYILKNNSNILEVNPYTSFFVIDKSIVNYEIFKKKYLED